MAAQEWRNFAGVFGRLRAPLRPTPEDVEISRRAIAGNDRRVLLLGVTPELSELGQELVGIDNSPRMFARVWPGDDSRRRGMIGDWLDLPFDDGEFAAVLGDGSLNAAPEAVEPVLREALRVLAPGGRAAFRVFCSPEEPETLSWIRRDVEAGWEGNFHALKWRVAMAVAADRREWIVPVRAILAAFDDTFPDRARLSSATGWPEEEIATIDAYANADHSLGFPTLRHMLALGERYFPSASVETAAGYPLAERCPTIIWSAV